jgi:hypothetical protein
MILAHRTLPLRQGQPRRTIPLMALSQRVIGRAAARASILRMNIHLRNGRQLLQPRASKVIDGKSPDMIYCETLGEIRFTDVRQRAATRCDNAAAASEFQRRPSKLRVRTFRKGRKFDPFPPLAFELNFLLPCLVNIFVGETSENRNTEHFAREIPSRACRL